jgi:hypothetical protein
MAATVLSDLIVPEKFAQYVVERTSEKSDLFRSGIVQTVPGLNLGDGGSLNQMPFWQDLAGDDQLLDDGTNLTVSAVTGQKDVAVLHARALVYGSTDIAAALAGDDPVDKLADLVVDKWDRQMQKVIINSLNGAIGAVSANVHDISGLSGAASDFDGEAFIDACAKLGDQSDRLSGLAVHSATYHSMLKQDLIDFIPDSEGKATIPSYQGKTVIVDDGLPVSSGTYTSYIFGMGAIGYGEGSPKVPMEIEREALLNGGEEYFVSRRHFLLHPRGVAWTPASGVPAKNTPSNTELADTGNWTLRYEAQNVRIVQFKHTVA